jgi:hypothetical protein
MAFRRCYPLFRTASFFAAVKLDFPARLNQVFQRVEGAFAVIE